MAQPTMLPDGRPDLKGLRNALLQSAGHMASIQRRVAEKDKALADLKAAHKATPEWIDMGTHPTMSDVLALKHFLNQTFPMEVVDLLMTFTEYWPHSACVLLEKVKHTEPTMLYSESITPNGLLAFDDLRSPLGYEDAQEDNFLLRSGPLGCQQIKSDPCVLRSGCLVRPHFRGIRSPRGAPFLSSHLQNEKISNFQKTFPQGWHTAKGRNPARKIILEVCNQVEGPPPDRRPDFWCEVRANNLVAPENQSEAASRPTLRVETTNTKIGPEIHRAIFRYDDDANTTLAEEDASLFRKQRDAGLLSFLGPEYPVMLHYAKATRREHADFVRQLQEGDSIGVWARGSPGGKYLTTSEEVRLHIFWAV